MAAEGAGGLKVTAVNGVKVYSIAGQKAAASWQPSSRRVSRRKDEEFLRRIELIQDLNFDTATSRIKATPDGEYLIASGIYPPQVHVYELREASLKFERHLTSEIIDFQILGDDFSKLAFLCSDRSVALHAKFGSYYSTRIPRMGRDLAYDKWSCDLLLAASSPEIYCLNLEQGQFLAPLTTRSPGINVLGRSSVHGLVACGGEDGALECFDMRQKSAVARIDAVKPTGIGDQEVTALRFDESEGLSLAVGTSAGQVLIYDLRSSAPLITKDHMYDSPIIDIKWHESLNLSSRRVISSDSKAVRVWDPVSGNGVATIEPSGGSINDVCIVRGSGMLLLAMDTPQIPTYFIPALGPAPKWCPYMENLTEEMEEGGQITIYDDYKFVTKEELNSLNLTSLIGTNLLRAYMHGYFIDHRLYVKAKYEAQPTAYADYLKEKVKEKLEAERATRIAVKRKLPKVNRELASKLLAGENGIDEGKPASKKKKGLSTEILKDERFSSLFTDKAFEINENSEEYKALHPNQSGKKADLLEEHFDPVDSDEDADGELAGSSDAGSDASLDEHDHKRKPQQRKKSAPRLYEAKDDIHADAFRKQKSLAAERSMPLEERVTAANKERVVSEARWGSREISFTAASAKKSSSSKPSLKPVNSAGRGKQQLRDGGRGGGRGGGGRGRGRGGGGRGGGGRGGRGRGRKIISEM